MDNRTLMAKRMKEWIDHLAVNLQNSDNKKFIEELIVGPLMKFILSRTFPYMIIAFCLFGAVFLFVILTFVLLLIKTPRILQCPSCKSILVGE